MGWFGRVLPSRVSCVEGLVPSVVMLGGGGTFNRWGLIEGNEVVGSTVLRKD